MIKKTHDRPLQDLTPVMAEHVPYWAVERYDGGRAVMTRGVCRVEKRGEETVYFYRNVLIQRRKKWFRALGEKFYGLDEVRKRVDSLGKLPKH